MNSDSGRYSIYKITNQINGKLYIGITKNSLKVRFQNHIASCVGYKGTVTLKNAIKKYGVDAFSIELIGQVDTLEKARNEEIRLISELNTYFANGKGYNMTIGGNNRTRPPKVQQPEAGELANIWVTKKARQLLRLIAAHTGQSMQSEAERIFEQELKEIEEGRYEGQTRAGNT